MGRSGWPNGPKSVISQHIQERALETCTGRCCAGCCSQRSRDRWFSCETFKCCGLWFMCFFIALLVCVAVIGGVLVNQHVKAKSFQDTMCNMTNKVTTSQSCTCGQHCYSNNYCTTVYVNYTKGSEVKNAIIWEFEGFHSCSYTTSCTGDETRKQAELTEYNNRIEANNGTHSCLYDPEPTSNTVIFRRRYNDDTVVIIAMVIPGSFLIGVTLTLFFLFCTCGCKYFWDFSAPEETFRIADNMEKSGVRNLGAYPYEERKRIVRDCTSGQYQNAGFNPGPAMPPAYDAGKTHPAGYPQAHPPGYSTQTQYSTPQVPGYPTAQQGGYPIQTNQPLPPIAGNKVFPSGDPSLAPTITYSGTGGF